MESTPTLTGAYADERLARAPQAIEAALWRIAARLGAAPDARPRRRRSGDARWEARGGQGAGRRARPRAGRRRPDAEPGQPRAGPPAERSAWAPGTACVALHRTGRRWARRRTRDALAALADDMHAGRSTRLLMLDTNPVYTRAGRPRFRSACWPRCRSARTWACTATRPARAAGWHLPLAHSYEAWSDARAHDGTRQHRAAADRAAVRRPLGARGAGHAGGADSATHAQCARPAHALVRATWRRSAWPAAIGTADAAFERAWQDALRRGVVGGQRGARGGGARGGAAGRGPRRSAAAAAGGRVRGRSGRRRRRVRQQWLAAGTAAAPDFAHLGQRRADRPGAPPRKRRPAQRRPSCACAVDGRTLVAPVLVMAGQAEGVRHAAARLRPQRRPARSATASASTPTALRTRAALGRPAAADDGARGRRPRLRAAPARDRHARPRARCKVQRSWRTLARHDGRRRRTRGAAADACTRSQRATTATAGAWRST